MLISYGLFFLIGIGFKHKHWGGAWTWQLRTFTEEGGGQLHGVMREWEAPMGLEAKAGLAVDTSTWESGRRGWEVWDYPGLHSQNKEQKCDSRGQSIESRFLYSTGSDEVDLTHDCGKPDFFFLFVFTLDPHAISPTTHTHTHTLISIKTLNH